MRDFCLSRGLEDVYKGQSQDELPGGNAKRGASDMAPPAHAGGSPQEEAPATRHRRAESLPDALRPEIAPSHFAPSLLSH